MRIHARIDGQAVLYLSTIAGVGRFTRHTRHAADIPSAMIDGVIRCLKIKMPDAKFWREDQTEPNPPPVAP